MTSPRRRLSHSWALMIFSLTIFHHIFVHVDVWPSPKSVNINLRDIMASYLSAQKTSERVWYLKMLFLREDSRNAPAVAGQNQFLTKIRPRTKFYSNLRISLFYHFWRFCGLITQPTPPSAPLTAQNASFVRLQHLRCVGTRHACHNNAHLLSEHGVVGKIQ